VTLTNQEIAVLEQLELLIRRTNSEEAAIRKLETITANRELVMKVVEYRREKAREKIEISFGRTVVDPDFLTPEGWYTGTSSEDLYWPKLKEALLGDEEWVSAVPSIDEASDNIVSLLPNPASARVRGRGLVIGYVQSGKTANYTATIAKAADAGYRMFIVLSGVHNALRNQTQSRLDKDLRSLNESHWLNLTEMGADFGNPTNPVAMVSDIDKRLVSVVKKNVSRLTRLRDWLGRVETHLSDFPILVIDDESDQASPNTSRDPELDSTTINRRIKEILEMPKVAYVGYTATPFANVLINPADARDLYPRDFMLSLPKPDDYFGADELFGGLCPEEVEAEADTPHDMIREIAVDEVEQFRLQAGGPPMGGVTPSLDNAVRWFLLATSARRARSGVRKHSSMLVHTTHRIGPMNALMPKIQDHIVRLGDELDRDRGQWEEFWVSETERVPAARYGHSTVRFEEVWNGLPAVIAETQVVADNSSSNDRLIYTDEPATVIAVGGNTLSRGLTLHGLVCSFFLRESSTYDSLLQMGRWFGYRRDYEDLPRIWTSLVLADNFRFLADVERELRADIDRYRFEKLTPREVAVRIRTHPSLQVTAKNKMHFAIPGEASYSGQHPQTTYFAHRDAVGLRANLAAARHLVSGAVELGARIETNESRTIVREVPVTLIERFNQSYAFHLDTALRSQQLNKYIASQVDVGGLTVWNIAIISRRNATKQVDMGLEYLVGTIQRSKLKSGSTESRANIGTLMSRSDRVVDLGLRASEVEDLDDEQLLNQRTESGRALLILYPIDGSSAPAPSKERYRSELGAAEDVLGVAYSFPRAVRGSAAEPTIQVDLSRLTDVVLEEPDGGEQEAEAPYEDTEGSLDRVDGTDV
jgi:hypothetical protein